MSGRNEFGQPVGADLGSWVPPKVPLTTSLTGRLVELRRLDPDVDSDPLFELFRNEPASLWTYMPFGPFASVDDLRALLADICARPDWLPFTIHVDGRILGFLSYLRIDPAAGTIEIGSIVFAPELQRTAAATEAIHLMIGHSFELGYRRCHHRRRLARTRSGVRGVARPLELRVRWVAANEAPPTTVSEVRVFRRRPGEARVRPGLGD